MNFGGFAGGFSHGFNNGVSMAKTIRDVIKERKLSDLREQGMAEAEVARAKSVEDSITENKSTTPASGPVEGVPTQASVAANGIAPMTAATSPTASPDAAAAATAASSIAPPALAAPAAPAAPAPTGPTYDTEGEAEARANMVKTQAAAPVAAAGPGGPTPQTAAATGVAPVTQKSNGRFSVGGKSYETREEAVKAAQSAAPSASDLFMKNTVPKIAAEYLAQGDPDKAKAWESYAESHNGKRAMKDWAAAYTAPDFDTAVSKFGKYYTDHINDGVDYTGHSLLTKSDGSQVAVVNLKDKATGKVSQMELTKQTMLQMGGSNNPQKLFENAQSEQREANKMKAERVIKREDREFTRETELLKQKASDEREAARRDAEAVRDDKRGDQRVNEIELKARLDADNAAKFKKATDPMERRALIRSDAMKNDTKFPRMSLEEQNKYLDDAMESIQGKPVKEEAAKPPTGNVTIETKPMPYKEGAPVKYNKADGKPYHLIDGKYIPIEGGVVPKKPAEPAAPAAPTVKAPGPKSGMPVNPGFTSKF